MEPRVDRPELPMELRQLKIDISGYKMGKIGSSALTL